MLINSFHHPLLHYTSGMGFMNVYILSGLLILKPNTGAR